MILIVISFAFFVYFCFCLFGNFFPSALCTEQEYVKPVYPKSAEHQETIKGILKATLHPQTIPLHRPKYDFK